MSVEQFTIDQFESALPATYRDNPECPWRFAGLEYGERVYYLRIRPNSQIYIKLRSSIRQDGRDAAAGRDSIRAWLVDAKGEFISYNVVRYVTRQAGWQDRMLAMLRRLVMLSGLVKPCKTCGSFMHLGQSRKNNSNCGRYFLSCKRCEVFEWQDQKDEIQEDV